jgi:hypothetical protein
VHDERAVKSGHCFVTRSARVELVSDIKLNPSDSVIRSGTHQTQGICRRFDIAGKDLPVRIRKKHHGRAEKLSGLRNRPQSPP